MHHTCVLPTEAGGEQKCPVCRTEVALTKAKAVSPKWSIYLGDPVCNHYYNGPVDQDCNPADPNAQDAHAEELIVSTPTAVTLNAEEGAFLSFWLQNSDSVSEVLTS